MYENVNNFLTDETNRLAEAFTCNGDGVITTDLEGFVLYMNEAAQNITEFSFTEVEGKNINEILSLININTVEPCIIPIDEAIQTGNRVTIEEDTIMITKDGTRIYICANCSPLLNVKGETNGVVFNFRDITEIKSMKEEILSNQKVFQIIFDTAPTAMVLVDNGNKIKNINKAWQDIIYIDEMSVLGKRFGDGFRCIESLLSGCGYSEKCIICTIRNNVIKVLETGIPKFDIILKHEFILNDKGFSPLLKTSFLPVIIKGENCVLIVAEDITHE